MAWLKKRSPYLNEGRLANVIAALQIMGAGERPEGEITQWSKELSKRISQVDVDKWRKVFVEHPEFFVVYEHAGQSKAALRWRYTNKVFDSAEGKTYTPAQKAKLPQEKQGTLTTPPLSPDVISALMHTAIELHSRAIEELSSARFWIPIIAGGLGSILALFGGIAVALIGVYFRTQ